VAAALRLVPQVQGAVAGVAIGAVNGAPHSGGSVGEAAAGAGTGAVVAGARSGIGALPSGIVAPDVARPVSSLASTELPDGLKYVGQRGSGHALGRGIEG